MKPHAQRTHDPLDLVVDCTFTVRTGDGRKLGVVKETVALPMGLAPALLESASENIKNVLEIGPIRQVQSIVLKEAKAQLPASVGRRLDRPHPAWVLPPDPEDQRYFSAELDHARREMEIADAE